MGSSRFVRVASAAAVAAAGWLAPGAAGAQPLQAIGTTSVGNPVLLEKGSVSRADGIITATVRVRFLKPVRSGADSLRSSRTIAMFDCAKQVVAVKENWYFTDAAGKKVANHRKVGIPGFGPAIKGSLPDVAMKHLCAPPG